MAYDQGIDSVSNSSPFSSPPDTSPQDLVDVYTGTDGAVDSTGLGSALAAGLSAIGSGQEDRINAVLDAVDPQQRSAVADACVAAAGSEALAEMAGTLDGQYALQALYDAAGAQGQAMLAEVARSLDFCPAVDFARTGAEATPQPPANSDEQKRELLLDLTQIGLAITGIVDPTPISDGLDGLISLGRGDWLGVGISVASMIPYVGDLSKVGKLEKFAEAITRAVDIARTDARFAEQLRPVLGPICDTLNAVPMDDLPGIVREPLQAMKNQIDEFFDAAADSRRLPDFADGARHIDPATGRTVIDARAGTTGDWNGAINRTLEPDVIYRTDTGYLYYTDAQGRVSRVEGELVSGTNARNGYQQSVAGGDDRLPTDQGGHLIASIFSGPGERINLVPMDANLNMSAWKTMENTWASALDSGRTVQVDIQPIYSGDSLRPDSFAVRYTIDGGRPVTEFFDNRPGG